MARQQFSLRWNNYLRHVTSAFDSLRCQEDLVDVTLCCEGKKIRAHKMILSACSVYFKDIFKENPCQHPVIIFRNVRYDDLCAIINFMYHGEVNIVQEQLASFLTTAELLQVQGLTDGTDDKDIEGNNELEVIKNQLSSDEMDITGPIFQAKKRKLSLNHFKRHKESDAELMEECSEIGIVELDPVPPEDNFKSESAEHSEERRDITTLISTIPNTSVISFPEEIEICSSQVFRNTSIINELKSTDGNNLTAEVPHDVGVDTALKDTSQGADVFTITEIKIDNSWNQPNDELKPYSCNKCSKCFKHPLSLQQHFKTHLGATHCKLCSKVLSRVHDLKIHLKIVHGINN